MAARNPQSPFEETLAAFSDEDLDAQEREYEQDIARLNFLLAAVKATREARNTFYHGDGHKAVPPRAPRTLIDAVLQVMLTRRDELWTADEVLDQLRARGWQPKGQTPKNSVDATLSRMVRDELIIRHSRGLYQLRTGEQQAILLATELGRASA